MTEHLSYRGDPTVSRSAVKPTLQYLYGSGEAAAISLQAWRGLVSYVAAKVRERPTDSVVLDEGATLAAPRFMPCGGKPLAAVFDVDETVLLNAGFEAEEAQHPGRPYDAARWHAYEVTGGATVLPVPGAAKALGVLRTMGVTIVFNTNRSAGNAAFTEATIDRVGLGPVVHGDTLFLAGDDATGARKDARRAAIARRFCVVAMGGDQLGDFSDLFDTPDRTNAARRVATLAAPAARLWGAGWFVLPNPVYGTAVQGGMDTVFPSTTRWSPR